MTSLLKMEGLKPFCGATAMQDALFLFQAGRPGFPPKVFGTRRFAASGMTRSIEPTFMKTSAAAGTIADGLCFAPAAYSALRH